MAIGSNILHVVHGHIDRVLPRDWWKCIQDYRYRSNRVGFFLFAGDHKEPPAGPAAIC